MAKEATLQVRMDADLKESVEQLYKSLGTSFAEAVRIFARQSVTVQGMPFVITAGKRNAYEIASESAYGMASEMTSGMAPKGAYGMLSKYAQPELMDQESGAFEKAMVERYAKAD